MARGVFLLYVDVVDEKKLYFLQIPGTKVLWSYEAHRNGMSYESRPFVRFQPPFGLPRAINASKLFLEPCPAFM
jgi:hypothetical protein